MYADLTVVVDGAVESDEQFFDEALMIERVQEIQFDAESDGYLTEVFIQYHDHDPAVAECSCAQYEQDHRPRYVFNGGEN